MTNPFAKPASASALNWGDHLGKLLLVEPKGVESGIPTVHGPADAVRADVTVVDADSGPQVYADTLIFPKVLMSQTRGAVGEMVLGRLGQGQAKPGQSAPWVLNDASETDVDTGVKYLDHRKQAQAANPFASTQGSAATAQAPF